MSACVTSPWGVVRMTLSVAPGIWLVTTASHGGFYLEPVVNAQVPLAWKQVSFKRQALSGFYEEQCDSCLVVLTFPHSFDSRALASAGRLFDSWMTPKLTAGARGASSPQEQDQLAFPLSLPPKLRVAKTN